MSQPFFLPARAGPESHFLSIVHTGDDIVWICDTATSPGDWSFVATLRDGVQTGLGWQRGEPNEPLGTGLAG